MAQAIRTEAELCRTIQTSPGNARRALDVLYRRHDKLIKKLALKYWIPGIDRDDLFQEAMLGFRYSCLSFDPLNGAAFNTHIGYGIMKYCRALHTTSTYRPEKGQKKCRLKRVPLSISQVGKGGSTHEHVPAQEKPRPVRLGTAAYNRLLKKIGKAELSEDDKLVIALAYSVGTKQMRKQWRSHLWQSWLDAKIADITQRAEAIRVARERKRKQRQTQRELFEGEKRKDPRRTQGGLGGLRR